MSQNQSNTMKRAATAPARMSDEPCSSDQSKEHGGAVAVPMQGAKRAKHAHDFYFQEMLPKTKEEFPALDMLAITEKMTARWGAMSYEETAKWQDQQRLGGDEPSAHNHS